MSSSSAAAAHCLPSWLAESIYWAAGKVCWVKVTPTGQRTPGCEYQLDYNKYMSYAITLIVYTLLAIGVCVKCFYVFVIDR